MSTLRTLLQSRRRLITWLGGLLLGYTLIGFLLLPWLVETQLESILDERLSVTLDVENIYFNPFSFYFEIEQLRLDEPEHDTLLHLGNLALNFQASRLALLKLQFAEIDISDLDIYYARNSTIEDTVSRLAQRWSTSADAATDSEADSEPTGELIPLEILSLKLSNIRTHILDEVPLTPFMTTLTLVEAQIDKLSTLPDQSGNNTLSVDFEEEANLSWHGEFSVNPLDFSGEIAVTNFGLLPAHRYLQDSLPFRIDEGHINLSFNYDINLAELEPRVRVDEINFAINELSATQLGQTTPFLKATSVALSGGELSLPENRVNFSTLSLRELNIDATRDASGTINFQEMLNALTASSETTSEETATEETTKPWFFSLQSLTLENNRISFTDSSLEAPFALATSLDANLSGIDNQDQTRFPFSTTLILESGGEIELAGEVQGLPALELESSLSLSNIAINVLQPYVNEFAFLEIESGDLNLDADLLVSPVEPFSFRGGVALAEVEISDQQLSETLFSMTSLDIDAVSLSLADNSVDISEISLQDFFARVLINEDGSSNIGDSIKSDAAPATTATQPENPTADSAPLAVTVGRVSLQNASADFTDLNLPLPFNANIQNLEGAVQGFANNSSQATEVNLEGQVDEFGLVQIVSSLNPFNIATQSQIDVNFSNIDMPAMTPYVIKFAGREIAEGKVDVDLSYSLLEGELTANNQLVLSALRLGERVEQAGAMDLPLDLAVALLKDGNGVIDLEVPISGNVNDPEFDFGPAIRRAITNILTNIVAAPFRLLGNLVGGGGDEGSLEQVRFLPGRADIAAPEQEILLQLSEALKQRPQLVLEIPAITAETDRPALQTRAVDERIEATLQAQPESDASLTDRRLAAVEALYSDTSALTSLDEIRLLHTPSPEAPADDIDISLQQTTPGQLDTLAYIADLRDRLIVAEVIRADELAALGSARQDSVIAFLSESGGVLAARLLGVEATIGEEDEDGWLLLPFGLTAQ